MFVNLAFGDIVKGSDNFPGWQFVDIVFLPTDERVVLISGNRVMFGLPGFPYPPQYFGKSTVSEIG